MSLTEASLALPAPARPAAPAGRVADPAGEGLRSDRVRRGSGMIPQQHGAWTILLAGFALGSAVGGISLRQAPLFGAVLAGFLARHAATRRSMTGTVLFALSFAALGVAAVVFGDLLGLVPIGALAVAAGVASVGVERRGGAFTPAGEALGILGLCLTAPAAEYAGAGTFSARTAGVGVLAAVFFLGGLLRVRYLVRHRRESSGLLSARFRAGWPSLAYQAAAVAAAAGLALAVPELMPREAALALTPGALQALGSVLRRRTVPAPVKAVGRVELAHSVVFTVIAVWALK